MFSGIVEEIAVIEEISAGRLRLRSNLDHRHTRIGDSVAVNGVCLTVVKLEGNKLAFDLSEETVSRTNLGSLKQGSPVNLERSLLIGERLHGHFVFGHVDAVAKLVATQELNNSRELKFELPAKIARYVTEKGSVSVNGVSLTVAAKDNDSFTVSIIPHTLKSTVFGTMTAGEAANIEVDMLARYVIDAAL